MIKYDHMKVEDITTTPDEFQTLLNSYGEIGWRFVTVYKGYIWFEQTIKMEQQA